MEKENLHVAVSLLFKEKGKVLEDELVREER